MSANTYIQTKSMLVQHVRLGVDTMKAALMSDAYVFNASHDSFTKLQGMMIDEVVASLIIASGIDKVRISVEPLLYEGITATAAHLIFYIDGLRGGVNSPVMLHVPLGSVDLRWSDFQIGWDVPLLEW